MENMIQNILIGAVSSLIATLVLWVMAQLFSFDTRKRIACQIILLRNDNYDYQKFLEYKDYALALSQSQRMLTEIGEIYSLIKLLTYLPKKRKFIYTLLNNLYNQISLFQLYYIGYNENTEKEACCEKAQRELYIIGYNLREEGEKYVSPYNYQSVSEVSIQLLSDLNNEKVSCKKTMLNSFCFNDNPNVETRKRYFHDLMNVKSFLPDIEDKKIRKLSMSVYRQYELIENVFTEKEYAKFIDSL